LASFAALIAVLIKLRSTRNARSKPSKKQRLSGDTDEVRKKTGELLPLFWQVSIIRRQFKLNTPKAPLLKMQISFDQPALFFPSQ
jgi:hypothetical protein